MSDKGKILIACHRHIAERNGGGEKSMWIIAKHLHGAGYSVMAQVDNCEHGEIEGIVFTPAPIETLIPGFDCVLTWGRPADKVARLCKANNVPYLLSVRWWRNVVDVYGIIGDLRAAKRTVWHSQKQHIFDNAAAVITNNHYSASIVRRLYGCEVLVSYVPIPGESKEIANPDGYVLAVSPNKGIGEVGAILDISAQMPNERFLIVNARPEQFRRANIKTLPYQSDMESVFRQCKMMIQPIYENDICGTLRVTIEAMRCGLPVIANDRCGMNEKIPHDNLVSYSAPSSEWVDNIERISSDWYRRHYGALDVFDRYDTPSQLAIFEREIEKAIKAKVCQ